MKPAFPSAPRHPGKYEIRITRTDGALAHHVFAAVYAARKFIDIVIGDREWGWTNRNTITCDDVTIRSKHLERYMTYEMEGDEVDWLLPMPYSYYARCIGHRETYKGASEAVNSTTHNPTSKSKRRKSRQTSPDTPENPASTSSKAKRDTKHTRKTGNGKTFDIHELQLRTNLKGSKIRAILRANMTKPTGGWEWPISEMEEILKLFKDTR